MIAFSSLLIAAPQRPTLVLRGGGGESSSDLLNSLQTVKTRLSKLEDRLKSSRREPEKQPEPVLAEPETGDRVRVRRDVERPRFDWGDGVDHDSVGRITWFSGPRCTVDFPRHPEWNGLLAEMERVAPGRELACVGDQVRVRRDVSQPAYGWGPVVDHEAVGEVVSLGYRTAGWKRGGPAAPTLSGASKDLGRSYPSQSVAWAAWRLAAADGRSPQRAAPTEELSALDHQVRPGAQRPRDLRGALRCAAAACSALQPQRQPTPLVGRC